MRHLNGAYVAESADASETLINVRGVTAHDNQMGKRAEQDHLIIRELVSDDRHGQASCLGHFHTVEDILSHDNTLLAGLLYAVEIAHLKRVMKPVRKFAPRLHFRRIPLPDTRMRHELFLSVMDRHDNASVHDAPTIEAPGTKVSADCLGEPKLLQVWMVLKVLERWKLKHLVDQNHGLMLLFRQCVIAQCRVIRYLCIRCLEEALLDGFHRLVQRHVFEGRNELKDIALCLTG